VAGGRQSPGLLSQRGMEASGRGSAGKHGDETYGRRFSPVESLPTSRESQPGRAVLIAVEKYDEGEPCHNFFFFFV